MQRHPLSRAQARATRAAMRLFVEEDRWRVDAGVRRWCEGCQRLRHAAGFITYDTHQLCNACATSFELARMRRRASGIEDFLQYVNRPESE